jgi:prepilin-type N-terminal cleavage/methylation domain-containing protein
MMRRRQRGFTLIEMIIVITIIAVLAAIALPAYKRYMDSGRAAEAAAMLGEIRTREEAYKAEYGSYLNSQTTPSEVAANLFPAVGTCPFSSQVEPCAKPASTTSVPAATIPTNWTTLGINSQKNMLYCGYAAFAGAGGTHPTLTLGSAILSSNQTGPWWYAIAICDNNRTVTNNTTYVTAYNSTIINALNEHQ